ncbi:MAG: CHASE4 domain-containing protein [Candidatus Bathyarchaeota archaeon]
MKIRRKALIIVFVITVGLILSLFASSQTILMSSYTEIEERNTRQDLERALSSLDNEINNLGIFVSDWASWDDTYQFVDDANEDYIASNLGDTTFTGAELNVMVYMNSSGNIVFSKFFDLQEEEEVPVPQSLQEHLSSTSLLVQHPDTESDVSGVILLSEGPMVIVSRPILTSEDEGPINGALIMGRYLDSVEINRLAVITHLSLTLREFNDPQLPADFETALSFFSEEEPVLIQPLSEETIAGYAVLKDIYGNSILVLRIDVSRDIYQQGLATTSFIIMAIVVVGIAFGLGVVLPFEKTVLSRLVKLSTKVKELGKVGNLSQRVSLTGKDELSELAGAINEMLGNLEETHNALKESEGKYRAIVENSPNCIVIIQDNALKYANKATCENVGWTFEEITTPSFNPIEKLVPLKFQDTVKMNIVKRLKGERIPPYEFMLKLRDLKEIPVMVYGERIIYQGKPADMVTFVDITEHKRVEAEKLSVMGQVARSIAHDIRNPLQAVRNAAYAIKENAGDKKEMAELIDRNITFADGIVRSLVDFASLPPIKLRKVDIKHLTQEILSQIVFPKNVKLTTNYGKIPLANVDTNLLGRIFQNMTLNALQAMPEGGELTVSTNKAKDLIEITITDTGVGIPKENLERIFDPFFTTKAKGTGLGLANSKMIIAAHKGEITTESKEGKGTTFTIRLPIQSENKQT